MNCCGEKKKGTGNPLKAIAIFVFVVGGGYYLWMEHRAHVFQYLPFAVFLLCPLMHLFGGHGGHGGHSEHEGHDHSKEKGDS